MLCRECYELGRRVAKRHTIKGIGVGIIYVNSAMNRDDCNEESGCECEDMHNRGRFARMDDVSGTVRWSEYCGFWRWADSLEAI